MLGEGLLPLGYFHEIKVEIRAADPMKLIVRKKEIPRNVGLVISRNEFLERIEVSLRVREGSCPCNHQCLIGVEDRIRNPALSSFGVCDVEFEVQHQSFLLELQDIEFGRDLEGAHRGEPKGPFSNSLRGNSQRRKKAFSIWD